MSSDSETQSMSRPSSPTSKDAIQIPFHQKQWTRPPISILSQDPLSRFVVFDGSRVPHIEPHFSVTERDPDYDRLVEARWYEHVAEHYLVNSGIDLSLARSEPLVNTPVQLYLAYNRLCRAQLEVSIYSKVLEQEIGQSLQKDFQRTRQLSLPREGVYSGYNLGFSVAPYITA